MEKSKEVLSILTEEQKKEIDRVIKKGNSMEIHRAKDGEREYEVRKRKTKKM